MLGLCWVGHVEPKFGKSSDFTTRKQELEIENNTILEPPTRITRANKKRLGTFGVFGCGFVGSIWLSNVAKRIKKDANGLV